MFFLITMKFSMALDLTTSLKIVLKFQNCQCAWHGIQCNCNLHSFHILLKNFLFFHSILRLDLHFVSCLFTSLFTKKLAYLDVKDDVEHDCDLYDWLDFLPPLFVSFQFLSFECFLLHIELVFWLLIWLQPEMNQIFYLIIIVIYYLCI